MKSDFKDAHERHWMDAELLYSNKRWANADHLYGMAAECALKRLMLVFGMPVDDKGGPQHDKDRKHADRIWTRYESYRCGHLRGTHYTLPCRNPFLDWDVSQRYANRANFDKTRAESHKVGAEAVRQLINKAIREGLI